MSNLSRVEKQVSTKSSAEHFVSGLGSQVFLGSAINSSELSREEGRYREFDNVLELGRRSGSIRNLAKAAAMSGKRLMIEIRDVQPVHVSFE